METTTETKKSNGQLKPFAPKESKTMNLQEGQIFLDAANRFIKDNPQETKFKYALEKVMKSVVKGFTAYNEEIEDVDQKILDAKSMNCATDADGIQKRKDDGSFTFTAEGEINARKEIRKIQKDWNDRSAFLLESSVFEFVPFFVEQKHIPVLGESFYDAFKGFVIE